MKAKFNSSHSFDDRNPSVGRQDAPKLTDLVEMLEWPKKGRSVQVRLVGPVVSRGLYKVKVRKKDGQETEITKVSLNYDADSDSIDTSKKCPYSKLPKDMAAMRKAYFVNAIVRPLQEDAPNKPKKPTKEEATSGFKEMDSDTWTPVRVIRIPSSLALRIKQLGAKNLVKSKSGDKKAFPATHEKYGFDLDMTFDKTLPPANMYSADAAEGPQGGKQSPLTEEEQNYLLWNIEEIYVPEDFATAKSEADSLEERWYGKKKKSSDDDDGDDDSDDDSDSDEDDEEDEDEDDAPKKSSKKPATKSKVKGKLKHVDEDEEESDDEEDDEMDLDDDEPPAKGKKSTKSKSKARDDDEESDDEDEESDDEDEDELDEDDEPPAKGKSSKKPDAKVKGKKAADEDEEDDELDDLDEEDEDSDSDSDSDSDDEDEDDEPPAKGKSSKKPAAKPKAKSKSKR
jgi:hypothetical protein